MPIALSVAAALGVVLAAPAEAATIKLATWNLNNLHLAVGEPRCSNALPGPTQTRVRRI